LPRDLAVNQPTRAVLTCVTWGPTRGLFLILKRWGGVLFSELTSPRQEEGKTLEYWPLLACFCPNLPIIFLGLA
jgi:hypothetical protein